MVSVDLMDQLGMEYHISATKKEIKIVWNF